MEISWLARLYVVICFALGCSCEVAQAENTAATNEITPIYGPQFKPEDLLAVKLNPCVLEGSQLVYWPDDAPAVARCFGHVITIRPLLKTRKQTEEGHATHVAVQLEIEGQATSQAMLKLEQLPEGFIDNAAFADLNGDGKPDFILEMSSHGNGLAAEMGGRLFLLSSPAGYRYLGLNEVMAASSLVRIAHQSTASLILQRLATQPDGSSSLRGSDGKQHTFFIFDLIQFDATAPKGARLDTRIDPRFPFWTRYTNSPSKVETSLLPPAQKKRLWRDPLRRAAVGKLVAR